MSQGNVARILRREGIAPGKGANRETIHLPMTDIARRYRSGYTTTELSAVFHVDDEIIRTRLIKMGVRIRRRGFQKRLCNPSWKNGEANSLKNLTQVRTDARVLASLCLGRPLTKQEVVHHMDEIPANNAIDNLRVFPSSSAHLHYHRQLERIPLQDRAGAANQLALKNDGQVLPPLPARIPFQLYKDLQSLYSKRWKTFVTRTMKRHHLLAILEPEPR